MASAKRKVEEVIEDEIDKAVREEDFDPDEEDNLYEIDEEDMPCLFDRA